jgi:putative tryptophan/tyrosine transport system substrate-binding protein
LVELRVDAIVTDGSPATQAAKNATQTVPIVGISNDLVGSGFVRSLSRPGGNITGISLLSADLAGRHLQLLSEIVGGLARVAVLSNPANPSHFALLQQMQAAASSLKIELHVAEARAPDLLESAFAAISAAQTGALIVLPDAMLFRPVPARGGIRRNSAPPGLISREASRRGRGAYCVRSEYPRRFPGIGRLRR